jgi:cysteine desulfurase
MKLPVYLDYNATTPIAPEVREAMLPFLGEHFGNPSSRHAYGKRAKDAFEGARAQVAQLLGARSEEIVFSSGASESNNLALKGLALARLEKRGHLITTGVEHEATLVTLRYLEREFGFALTVLPVDAEGRVDPDDVRRALRPDTFLISVMQAQNETGALQPIAEIGRLAREREILFHVDGAQSVGKIAVDVEALGCDLLSVAAHKFYGPKGVGALYVRTGVSLHPLIHGAPYEAGRRGGTANVSHGVGLGTACALSQHLIAQGEPDRLRALRDGLHRVLERELGAQLNGPVEPRLPNTLNVSLPGVVGNDLLAKVPELAASTGSACHAGVNKPSPILLAMGHAESRALGALRLSLGRYSTAEELDFAAQRLVDAVRQGRG